MSNEKLEISKHFNLMATILGAIIIIWQIHGIDSRFESMENRFLAFDTRLCAVEKDVATIKTVLMMKEIFPKELAKKYEEGK